MIPLFLVWDDGSTSFNEIIVGQCEEVYKSCCASSCLDCCGYNILQWCFIGKFRNQMLVLHSQSSCRGCMHANVHHNRYNNTISPCVLSFWMTSCHALFKLLTCSLKLSLSESKRTSHGMLYWSVNYKLISPLLIWLMYCPIVVFLDLLLSIWKLNTS